MKLFDLLKPHLKEPKGVISDNEMVLLNRRDFLYSETSAAASFLNLFNAGRVTYEMYSIVDCLHSILCKLREPTEVRVYQMSPSMTLPSLATSVFVGSLIRTVKIHAPRGCQKLKPTDHFSAELLSRFEGQLDSGLAMSDIGDTDDVVDILFCNASNEAEVSSALKAFENVRRGFIVIKGYGRYNAPNCGDIILSARLNVHCSLAGFGICIAI